MRIIRVFSVNGANYSMNSNFMAMMPPWDFPGSVFSRNGSIEVIHEKITGKKATFVLKEIIHHIYEKTTLSFFIFYQSYP
ncbi:MAG TPA: hypothetical protein VLS85_07665 [Hanamia sp.]|nr:hypothetical protein [Hanamia sp.]